jgi:hypothetical protein
MRYVAETCLIEGAHERSERGGQWLISFAIRSSLMVITMWLALQFGDVKGEG